MNMNVYECMCINVFELYECACMSFSIFSKTQKGKGCPGHEAQDLVL